MFLALVFSDLSTKWIESYGPQIAILKLKLLIILNLKPLLKNKHDCLYTQFWVQKCPFNSIYNFIYITTSSLFQIKQPMAQFYCTKCSRIKADGPCYPEWQTHNFIPYVAPTSLAGIINCSYIWLSDCLNFIIFIFIFIFMCMPLLFYSVLCFTPNFTDLIFFVDFVSFFLSSTKFIIFMCMLNYFVYFLFNFLIILFKNSMSWILFKNQ